MVGCDTGAVVGGGVLAGRGVGLGDGVAAAGAWAGAAPGATVIRPPAIEITQAPSPGLSTVPGTYPPVVALYFHAASAPLTVAGCVPLGLPTSSQAPAGAVTVTGALLPAGSGTSVSAL